MKKRTYNNFELLLFAASELVVEDEAEEFLAIDTSNFEVDERKKKCVKRLIRRARAPKRHPFKLLLVACLIIFSLAFTACVSIPKLREAIYNVIVEWYEGHVGIPFDDPIDPKAGTSAEAPTQTEATPFTTAAVTAPLVPIEPPERIESKAYPTYLPEECYTVVELESQITYMISAYTENGDQWLCTLTQTVINGELHLSDNENYTLSNILINGCNAVLLEDTENHSMYGIVWRDGYYDYQLYGCFQSSDIAIQIASGVITD